ncbi:MAG: alpha/beta hydrolase [Candidatus Promineifilaceae bacterium]|jgi:pimeloyl-ACP methyl ester carboxylesterase
MQKIVKPFLLFIVISFIVACDENGNDNSVVNIGNEIAAIEAEAGDITEIGCPLKIADEKEGETYSCGIYTVPVDYENPDSKTLNLTYVVLKAASNDPLPDPIIYLAGGPGQSSVVTAGDQLYGDLRQSRDLIFPAQRGTLFSNRLALEECVELMSDQLDRGDLEAFVDEVSTRVKPEGDLPYDEYLAAYSDNVALTNARCHEAFSQAGLDPAQFNTANSTNDVVGLVASLGYDSFNLHGVSYGTRLALETMRRHPEANIRSVVLDSPAPPTEKRLEDSALALQTIVIRLFADCEANADCNAAYPNLVERTAALMAELAEQPITAGDQTIGADELRAQLVDLSATRANYVPRLIAELEAGDATTYLALLNGEVGVLPPEGSVLSAEGLNLIALISEGGMTAEDPFAGVKMVAEVLAGVEKESPRQAMKAIVQEKLADSEKLPLILEGIDRLTPDDLHTLQAQMSAPASEVDEAEAQKNAEAIAKNDAHFLLNGIVCLEQLPFEDVETVLAMKNDLVIPELATADSLLATEVGNCTNYPMGETDRTYHEPVTSQIPTLILQGEFDTRTPLQNGRSLSEQLSNDTLVIIPQVGHETWTSATSCVGQISINFISNPEQGPDLSCLAQRQEHFSLPDEPLTSSE